VEKETGVYWVDNRSMHSGQPSLFLAWRFRRNDLTVLSHAEALSDVETASETGMSISAPEEALCPVYWKDSI
jgi:hypothetical protein